MKRFVAEYAKDIQKEINRRIELIHNPKKMTAYNLKDLEEKDAALKGLMVYAEHDLVTEWDAMRSLVEIDPRN